MPSIATRQSLGSFAGRRATLVGALAVAVCAAIPLAAQQTGAGGARGPEWQAVLATPDGDTVAVLSPAATGEVVEVADGWVRVRFEGWARRPDGEREPFQGPSRALGLAALRADPERYRGVTVEWRVQHIAVQRADSLRSDMEPGETYLLVRDPGGEPGFAYVVVPAALRPHTEGLAPLQRLEIVARIRAGRSPLTGHPILELIDLRR